MIRTFDVEAIRQDFPALRQQVHGRPLVYFDNAATSQKPQVVIDRLNAYYQHENANIHRGVHFLSAEATSRYEEAREAARRFLGAAHSHEVIFTSGTTEGINLVAASFGQAYVRAGDEILISGMEHHSNIVPWQMLCERSGAKLKVIPVLPDGSLDMEALPGLLTERTRLVAVVHTSNSLGTVNPVAEIIAQAHARDIPVLIDGAQAVPHRAVDVQALDCDFFVCSAHKMAGPTGVGLLYGKEKWLDAMPPYMGGGDMIDRVTFEKTTYNSLPHKFEAGTPHISGGIALEAAITYLEGIGMDQVAAWEGELLRYGTQRLGAIDGLRLIGTAPEKASVISFLLDGIHPYDGGTILDQLGIAIRTGHHCTQPLMDQFGIPGTMRASFAFYNTREEIDRLVEGLQRVRQMFG